MSDPTPPPTALEASLFLIDSGPFEDQDALEATARILAAEYRRALAALMDIEARYNDGGDTYETCNDMGTIARDYLDVVYTLKPDTYEQSYQSRPLQMAPIEN